MVPVIAFESTGTRGTFTMPDSMASISEKSDTTHGKSVPFVVAAALQEERRGREVVHRAQAELAWTASSPDIHTRASSSRFFASTRSSPLRASASSRRLAAVAVVRLVVEDDDLLLARRAHDTRAGPSGPASP